MSSIFMNNKFSDKDFGLIIENIPKFPVAANKYDEIDIPGSKNGSVHIITGKENMKIQINFVFKCKDDVFFLKKAKIISWIQNRSSNKLIYSLNKLGYFLIKEVNISEFVTTSKIVRRFTVEFTLYPYCYINSGEEEIEINTITKIYNNSSTCITEPRITIYGTGDMTVNINGRQLILKGVDESPIVVDSFENDCYKLRNPSIKMNNKMYSKFPYLDVGENIISFSNNVNKIGIIPRWCFQ